MHWYAEFLTAGAGWDRWLLMCGAVVAVWVLAVAGMVALFRASGLDSHARASVHPAPPPPMGSGDVSANRYQQSSIHG